MGELLATEKPLVPAIGALFSAEGLRVPFLTEEQKVQRIAAYGGIIEEIDINVRLGRPRTQVAELEAERYRLSADRTILSKQLSSVALADEVRFDSPSDYRLL